MRYPTDHPARRPRRGLSLLLALALAVVLPLAARAQTLTADDAAVAPEGRTPIVLVHGHCLGRETWTHPGGFADHARATAPFADRYALYHFDYPIAEGGACADAPAPAADEIRDLARALSAALDTHAAIGPDAEIVLVGHGTGGLVARALMQEMGAAHRVRIAMTLATPHHGGLRAYGAAADASWLACLNGAGGRGCRGGDATARRLALPKIVAFGLASAERLHAGAPDDGVVPIASALFDGAAPGVRRRYAGVGGRAPGSTCAADESPHLAITHGGCLVQDDEGGEPMPIFAAMAGELELPPDLVVTAIGQPPFHIAPGKTLSLAVVVENQGLGSASGSTVRVYASTDQAKGATDRPLGGTLAFASLGVGASATRTGTLTLPADIPLGTYYLIACADDQDQVAESNEANNCTASSVTMVVTRADLTVQSVTAASTVVAPGGTIAITDTTRNDGMVVAEPSQTRYYLSSDQTKSAGDVPLGGAHAVPALGTAPPHTATVTATVPASTPTGAYYVIACADDGHVVDELDETDNCRATAAALSVTRPDLVVISLINAPATAAPGGGFTVTSGVRNAGLVPSPASQTRFYLATGPGHQAGDVPLGGVQAVSALTPGGSAAATTHLTVPANVAPGVYYVVACADGADTVAETNEANNCRVSLSATTIGRPDLVVQTLSSPPAAATPGGTFPATAVTRNQGTAASVPTQTRFSLSLDVVRSAQDRLLTAVLNVAALPAGGQQTGTVTLAVPPDLPPAFYYVLACADHAAAVVELDEDNNCTASATMVRVGRPDLIVSYLSDPPAVARVGDGITINLVTTRNQGQGAAPASRTKLYLSDDTIKSGNDRLLPEDISVPPLAASQSADSSFALFFSIPASTPLGTYHVIACADALGAVSEGDEANNCRASTTTVIVTRPDLVVSEVLVAAASVPRGGIVPITDTTLNQGLATALPSTTRYYLSTDQAKSGNDVPLSASRPIPLLVGGDSSTGPVSATVPASTPPGVYWVLACADSGSAIAELVETNNCRAGAAQVTVTP